MQLNFCIFLDPTRQYFPASISSIHSNLSIRLANLTTHAEIGNDKRQKEKTNAKLRLSVSEKTAR